MAGPHIGPPAGIPGPISPARHGLMALSCSTCEHSHHAGPRVGLLYDAPLPLGCFRDRGTKYGTMRRVPMARCCPLPVLAHTTRHHAWLGYTPAYDLGSPGLDRIIKLRRTSGLIQNSWGNLSILTELREYDWSLLDNVGRPTGSGASGSYRPLFPDREGWHDSCYARAWEGRGREGS